jgi:hypothetical protein
MDLKAQVQRLLAAQKREQGPVQAYDDAKSNIDEPLLPLRSVAAQSEPDAEVSSLGARLAAMHLAYEVGNNNNNARKQQQRRVGDYRKPMSDEEFDASVNGDNSLDALAPAARLAGHPVRMTEEEFQDFINGDNGVIDAPRRVADIDADANVRETLDWIDGKKQHQQEVTGFFTDMKNLLFAARLLPATDAQVQARIAGPLLSAGALNLRPATGHAAKLVVETLGGNRRYANSNNEERLAADAPGAHVYPLSQSNMGITRNDFFRSGHESAGGKITFVNPATNEPETWKLTFDADQARWLQQSNVWSTKPGDLMLLLRFAPEGANPPLREVVVLSKPSSSSLGTPLPTLDAAELALAEQVLRGANFSTKDVKAQETMRDPENAHRVLGRALSALSHAYLGKVDDFGPASSLARASVSTDVLTRFAVACHEKDMGDQDDEDGVAARRGEALAKHIEAKLRGAAQERICAAVHTLASAATIAHMCLFRSHAASAEHRMNMFLAAPAALRKDKVSLHATYFG